MLFIRLLVFIAEMKRFVTISLLLLVVIGQQAHSRSIKENTSSLVCDGVEDCGRRGSPSFLEWRRLSAPATVTCEPIYGFLPCSTNIWGLLFLIVVYEILLSIGGQYVANGSNLFFQIIGPGVVGGSLFQLLGTMPQIILVLVSALSGTTAAAQQRATLGMGLVAGTTVMLLTLIWGSSVILGSYDLSEATVTDNNSGTRKKNPAKGNGVVTDIETSYTARIMLITLVPFLVLALATFFDSSSGRRVIVLIALIITIVLLIVYVIYQISQPWIQNRCFEYLINNYAKDKLLRLISSNGKPDTRKIQGLFNKINKSNNASISAAELRVLLLGVKLDDDDTSTERDVEIIMKSFDASGDGLINQDEFMKGMTKLVSDLSNQTSTQVTTSGGSNSQNNTSQAQQGLLASSTTTTTTSSTSTTTSQTATNSWSNYLRATFFLIFGTLMLCALSEPMIRSVIDFALAANLSSFSVSYLAIPFAMNYAVAIQSIASARQKTQRSISLTLSSLYGGVYMNNVIGLMVFLAPVYARNLSSDVRAEVLVVLVICILMSVFTSFYTTFPRWTGYLVLLLYPISLATVHVLTSVYGWS